MPIIERQNNEMIALRERKTSLKKLVQEKTKTKKPGLILGQKKRM